MSTNKRLHIFSTIFGYDNVHPLSMISYLQDIEWCKNNRGYKIGSHINHKDAAIDRARCVVAEIFLKTTADVLVMVDHDIQWAAGGSILLAEKAVKYNAIIACAVSKKGFNTSLSSSLIASEDNVPNVDGLLRARYCATSFIAYPRQIIEHVASELEMTRQEFRPMFMPIVVTDPDDGKLDYLSEDWSFHYRAKQLGYDGYVDLTIPTIHYGYHGYTLDGAKAKNEEENRAA